MVEAQKKEELHLPPISGVICVFSDTSGVCPISCPSHKFSKILREKDQFNQGIISKAQEVFTPEEKAQKCEALRGG